MNYFEKLFYSLNEGWKRIIYFLFAIEVIGLLSWAINNPDDAFRDSKVIYFPETRIIYEFSIAQSLQTFIGFVISIISFWAIIFIFLWIREGFRRKQ